MKRIIATILALMLALALCACGDTEAEKTDNGGSVATTPAATTPAATTPAATTPAATTPAATTPAATTPAATEPDESEGVVLGKLNFIDIMSGKGGNEIISKMSSKEKAEIVKAGKAEGIEVVFKSDGSTVFTNEEGDTVTQYADGTWKVVSSEGEAEFGGNWPENEFTKLVPKPEFDLIFAAVTEEGFAVKFADITLEDIKAYAGKVKTAGFNIGVEEMEIAGIYIFSASNAAGYSISITFGQGENGMFINPPGVEFE